MGRWQTEYYDQVLGLKLKTLVCGAIARAKLERNDPHPPPQISYESFVQSLDHGDSFTTTLVDILVKELAERQKRPSSSDRHLLAERTVRSLKNLTGCRIYRQPIPPRSLHDFYVSRSSDNTLSDWAGNPVPPDPLELEIDEEEIDPPTPPSPSDPTVFQPFAELAGPPILRGSFATQTADVSTDDENQHFPPGYQSRGTSSTIPHYNLSRHSSLNRDPSIRRLVRSRTNDFNEFTSRRRALGRSGQTADQEPDAPDRLSTSSTRRSTSSDVNVAENSAGRDRGTEIDGVLPAPTNGNTVLRRNDILRLRSSEDPEYTLESALTTRSNFHLYGSRTNAAAPSSSRLTVHIPRRPRIRRSNPSNAAPTSTDGYTHTVRIGSPPVSNHPELQSTRFSLPRSASPLDVEYLRRLAGEYTPPPFVNADDTAASSGNTENREQVSNINLPTPRSISPEGRSLSQ